MTDNDKLIFDTIRGTLTDNERVLFDRVMQREAYCRGSIGQLVAEALRRREKLDLLPDHG
jgi:hypothetical protein